MAEEYGQWLKASDYADVQPAHSAAIQPLWEHPEGVRLTSLARASRVTKQSMSALLDHLEKHGYVERVPDPDDARASLVRLTARGRTFARAVRGFAQEMEGRWAEQIGARRVDDLRASLELLRRAWTSKE